MFQIALFEPQIAPNTGNIIRLAANNGCKLHLIEPLGFSLDEKQVRRAGLDYHDLANIQIHKNFSEFQAAVAGNRVIACTTRGTCHHSDIRYQADDVLLFGAETHGLSTEAMESVEPALRIKIPMMESNRSLNLSNSVAIISYEAWRQLGYAGAN
ncbi:tRNA (cytidine(34)-2'-O)-methyltransferase [Algibacillus agarilyticus]|uniref:tRNA (cytidine(34)-2'-O)-methyltransferase n=1 Tax=Algibacillus agarilyticus TaxID=2234133 RepID=UPI000DD076A7|nr:tRNA (cytidine(34)-2'-O)-methyltransferase [Algibacillus agarilyticus]